MRGHCTANWQASASYGSQLVPGCHAPCSSSSFVTAAHVAIASLRSFRPQLRSIPPRSYLVFASRHAGRHVIARSEAKKQTRPAYAFPQANATILTGFHSTSLRPSFTSGMLCPPAAHYLARRRPTSAALSVHPYGWLIPSVHSPPAATLRLHSSATCVYIISYSGGLLWSWHRCSFVAALLPAPSWVLAAAFVRSSLRRLSAARLPRFSPSGFRGKANASF